MTSYLDDEFGNPSGAHRMARRANQALDEAREVMAEALGCAPGDVVFTGGGTEADNLAIFGSCDAGTGRGRPVCSAVEHHAVLEPVEQRDGVVVGVDGDGQLDLDQLASGLDETTAVVSVMLANNETGVVQPLDDVVECVRRHAPRATVHTDAVQAMCWLDVAALAASADLVSISAHKFGGPKGVGALVVRPGTPLAARAVGGGQERGRRGGTQNVAGIVAMAAAAAATVAERTDQVARVRRLRDRLIEGITTTVDGAYETGPSAAQGSGAKTANIAHLCFDGVDSEALLFLLERGGVMASAASSCSSGAMQSSHVLTAMGVEARRAQGSLRLSLGYTSTDDDVDAVLGVLPAAVGRLRTEERVRG